MVETEQVLGLGCKDLPLLSTLAGEGYGQSCLRCPCVPQLVQSVGLDLAISFAREGVCQASGVVLPLDEPELQWCCLLASFVNLLSFLHPDKVQCSPRAYNRWTMQDLVPKTFL